jgi:flagellar biosynthetic protein FliQ
MTETDAINIFHLTLYVLTSTAGPMVASAMLVGLVVALLQALTQIQEATLTFVPKIVAIAATVIVAAPFMGEQLKTFSDHLFALIQSGFSN